MITTPPGIRFPPYRRRNSAPADTPPWCIQGNRSWLWPGLWVPGDAPRFSRVESCWWPSSIRSPSSFCSRRRQKKPRPLRWSRESVRVPYGPLKTRLHRQRCCRSPRANTHTGAAGLSNSSLNLEGFPTNQAHRRAGKGRRALFRSAPVRVNWPFNAPPGGDC